MSKIKRLTKADAEKFATVEEASQLLDVKPSVLRNYLYQDKLTTYKFKTLTLLDKDELAEWRGRK